MHRGPDIYFDIFICIVYFSIVEIAPSNMTTLNTNALAHQASLVPLETVSACGDIDKCPTSALKLIQEVCRRRRTLDLS